MWSALPGRSVAREWREDGRRQVRAAPWNTSCGSRALKGRFPPDGGDRYAVRRAEKSTRTKAATSCSTPKLFGQ
jgi:hypothetical protein